MAHNRSVLKERCIRQTVPRRGRDGTGGGRPGIRPWSVATGGVGANDGAGQGDRIGAAIREDGAVDGVGGAGFRIGDKVVGNVVGDAIRPTVPVQLVLGFEVREASQGGQNLAGGALGGAVVHDGDGGVEGAEQARVVAPQYAGGLTR